MSVVAIYSDDITRANAGLDGIKAAIEAQGQPVPEGTPVEDYPDKILSIANGPHEVRFFDIDGTVLSSKCYHTGQSAAYPAEAPCHDEWLEFAGWNYTLEELSNLRYRESERGLTIPGHIDVGATYRTVDDCTHIWFKAVSQYTLACSLYFARESDAAMVDIDWGDGVTEAYTVPTGGTKAHTYSDEGLYHIKVKSRDNVPYRMGNGTASTPMVASTSSAGILKVYFSDYVVLRNYTCYNFYNLRYVSLPANGQNSDMVQYLTYNNYMLRHLTIPRGYTTIAAYSFNSAKQMRSISIPATVQTLEKYGMFLTAALGRYVLPRGISSLPDNFFDNGSASEQITDTIREVGINAFYSYYLSHTVNLAYTVRCSGTGMMLNTYSLPLHNLRIILTGTAATNTANWVQLLRGTLELLPENEMPLPALANNNGLQRLVIGENFTSITGSITSTGITELVFLATVPPALANASYISALNKLGAIYVPVESVAAYKAAANWSTMAKYIKPLSELELSGNEEYPYFIDMAA